MLLIALFPRVWGTVRSTSSGEIQPHHCWAYSYGILVRHLYGQELYGIYHAEWRAESHQEASHITFGCVMADPALLRFQACLEGDSCSLLPKRWVLHGAEICARWGNSDGLTDRPSPLCTTARGRKETWNISSQPGRIGNGKTFFDWTCKSDFSREQSFAESVPEQGQAAALCLVTRNRFGM